MAYPTQITIASGKTVYAGDESDGITSRQVQISITYQLERADEDLLRVTAAKAREVEAAQEVVWHHVWGDRMAQERQTEEYQTEMDLPPRSSGDEDDPSKDENDPGPPCDGNYPEDSEEQDGEDETGDWNEDRADEHDGHVPACPSPGPEPVVPEANGLRERPVTKPQRLAIMAQARRLGLSDLEMVEMIRSRFGKTSYTPRYILDKITKKEGDALLRALAEQEWQAIRVSVPEQSSPV